MEERLRTLKFEERAALNWVPGWVKLYILSRPPLGMLEVPLESDLESLGCKEGEGMASGLVMQVSIHYPIALVPRSIKLIFTHLPCR